MDKTLKVIGILGGGQLASMLADTIQKRNCEIVLYVQDLSEPACHLSRKVFVGAREDKEKLAQFFKYCDVVLLESEFYAPELLKALEDESGTLIVPELESYKQLFSKRNQKEFFKNNQIPFVNYCEVKSEEDLQKIHFSGPYMIKKSHGGYDGYGNQYVETKEELKNSIVKISNRFENLVLVEQFIEIKNEFSILLVKSKTEMITLPPCKTTQEDSICTMVSYPSRLSTNLEEEMCHYVKQIGKNLNGRGVFAFEFFETVTGKLLINEAAPRVHNSFHFTIEGFDKSQFDYFLDIVLGVPLKKPVKNYEFISMVNLLGKSKGSDFKLVLPHIDGDYDLKVHMYGKEECRVGRKMGHVTLFGNRDNVDFAHRIKQGYKL